MKKIMPTGVEAQFTMDELFFSITDKSGVIKFGNDVFIRVSGYPKEQIMGAAHNIIRHPDVPKAIFKLFWGFLKDNRPVFAYVKNMAANGDYYWVFAAAFPLPDGYLSIRIKPSSSMFAQVKALYGEILDFEQRKGMEEAGHLLQQRLGELGFKGYQDFMVKAATEEFKSRDAQLNHGEREKVAGLNRVAKRINEITGVTQRKLETCFSGMEQMRASSDVLQGCLGEFKKKFAELFYMSINMQAKAEKFGHLASSLNVVSSEFSKLSSEAEIKIGPFFAVINQLAGTIETSTMHIVSLKTQILMVDFFVRESMAKLGKLPFAFAELLENKTPFCDLYSASITDLPRTLFEMKGQLSCLETNLNEVQELASGLEVIRQIGNIERTRHQEIKEAFAHDIEGMKDFNAFLRVTLSKVEVEQKKLVEVTKDVSNTCSEVSGNLSALFEQAQVYQA